jgi:hypothetical protein
MIDVFNTVKANDKQELKNNFLISGAQSQLNLLASKWMFSCFLKKTTSDKR